MQTEFGRCGRLPNDGIRSGNRKRVDRIINTLTWTPGTSAGAPLVFTSLGDGLPPSRRGIHRRPSPCHPVWPPMSGFDQHAAGEEECRVGAGCLRALESAPRASAACRRLCSCLAGKMGAWQVSHQLSNRDSVEGVLVNIAQAAAPPPPEFILGPAFGRTRGRSPSPALCAEEEESRCVNPVACGEGARNSDSHSVREVWEPIVVHGAEREPAEIWLRLRSDSRSPSGNKDSRRTGHWRFLHPSQRRLCR